MSRTHSLPISDDATMDPRASPKIHRLSHGTGDDFVVFGLGHLVEARNRIRAVVVVAIPRLRSTVPGMRFVISDNNQVVRGP